MKQRFGTLTGRTFLLERVLAKLLLILLCSASPYIVILTSSVSLAEAAAAETGDSGVLGISTMRKDWGFGGEGEGWVGEGWEVGGWEMGGAAALCFLGAGW